MRCGHNNPRNPKFLRLIIIFKNINVYQYKFVIKLMRHYNFTHTFGGFDGDMYIIFRSIHNGRTEIIADNSCVDVALSDYASDLESAFKTREQARIRNGIAEDGSDKVPDSTFKLARRMARAHNSRVILANRLDRI